MTQSNEPTIDVMNEAIAVFMGFEKVRVGYIGCKDGDPEYDETAWQVANEEWLEKMGIENIGYYVVNVNGNEWYEWRDVEYHNSWDWLHPVWDKLRTELFVCMPDCGFNDGYDKFGDAWKTACFNGEIVNAHKVAYGAIQWYNQQKQKDEPEQTSIPGWR